MELLIDNLRSLSKEALLAAEELVDLSEHLDSALTALDEAEDLADKTQEQLDMANLRIEDLRVDLDSALTALYTEEERADEAEKRAAELQEQLDMANKEIAELKYTLKLADQQIKELRPW